MAYRLQNQNNPEHTLTLTVDTWFGLLDLAEEQGWYPLGPVVPGQWSDPEDELAGYPLEFHPNGNGDGEEGRLVILEDALNLADALEQAFLAYEHVFMPASFFYFEPLDPAVRLRPSIGALAAVIDFCQLGAFWIEPYRRPS